LRAAELLEFIQANEGERGVSLPVSVGEHLAAHFGPFWQKVDASETAVEDVQADLATLLETIDRQPEFVSRYFKQATPRAEESKLVMSVLFGGKIRKLADVTDADLREDIFPNQGMLDEFNDSGTELREAKVGPLVKDYLAALVAANVAHLVRPSYDAIARIADAHTTLADVTVQSAVALSPGQQDKMRAAVSKYLPKGKDQAYVEFQVDPAIGGGLVVTIDNTVVDLSAATYLSNAASAVHVSEERI
jgi:F0F1-type ATP synthase delta subunit